MQTLTIEMCDSRNLNSSVFVKMKYTHRIQDALKAFCDKYNLRVTGYVVSTIDGEILDERLMCLGVLTDGQKVVVVPFKEYMRYENKPQ